MTTIRPDSARAWVLAARLKTLPAALAPVAVGAGVAHVSDTIAWWPLMLAALGAVAIQIGTNFANDVFDFEKGADTEERLGPTRAVQAGLLSPQQMRAGMIAAFAAATGCGLALTALAGWPVVAIGIASIASGIAYTGGPYPLGYNGLGDVFVFVFFGVVAVAGTAYVQLLWIPALALWLALPVGALATAILVVNNLRDHRTDRIAGKRTLAVRLGPAAARLEYLILVVLAYVVPVALWLSGLGSAMLLPLVSAPMAARLIGSLWTREGADLNPVLARTAGLLMVHAALTTASLVLVA